MSSDEPAKFESFFWEAGEGGDADYSKYATKLLSPGLNPIKYKLAAAIGKSEA